MALASWSYRGISGRECSVAGSRLTFRQVRWVCRLRLSGPLSFDATGGPAPLRSVSFSACAERATCQVSGLNSSNFQCCAEIEKSPYPPVAVGPTRRTDKEQAEGERCLTIPPSFAASTDGVFFLIHSPAIKLRRDRGTSSPWSGAVTFPVSRCQRLTKFRLAAHFGGSPASKWFEWGGIRSACASVDRQQLRCGGDRALSLSSFPLSFPPSSSDTSRSDTVVEQVPHLWTPPVPVLPALAMASQETGAGAGAAQPGDEKDGRSGPMALNPGVPIRGIRMKFAVLAGLVEVGEVSNRDIVETVLNLVSWLRPLRIGLSDGSTVTARYRRWHSDSGSVCLKSDITPHLHSEALMILFL